MRRFAVFALLAALVVGVAPSFFAAEPVDKWAEHKGNINFTIGYEEGMKLARVCSEMLASAELRITRIQTAYGEQMRMLEEQGQGSPPC